MINERMVKQWFRDINEGLGRFANDPTIMKYDLRAELIKTAASLELLYNNLTITQPEKETERGLLDAK